MAKPKPIVPKRKRPQVKPGPADASRRRAEFAHEYLANNGNATAAALKAGYSPKTAYSLGSRLLKHVEVKAIIDSANTKAFAEFEITTERILRERASLAYSNMVDFYDKDGKLIPIHKLPRHIAAAINSIEFNDDGSPKKYRTGGKDTSLQAIERMRGMYAKDNEQLAPPPADGEDSSLNAIARGMAFIFRKAMQNGGK